MPPPSPAEIKKVFSFPAHYQDDRDAGMIASSLARYRSLVREVRAETAIDAPPAVVWRVLTDFASYPDWNPFIRSIEGKPWVGTRLSVDIRPPGRRSMRFRPMVLRVAKDRELRWIGRVLVAGLFDGEHRFTIIPEGDGSRFVQAEVFTGLLVPVVDLTSTLRATHLGFLLMNQALRGRAERSIAGEPS